MSSNQFNHNFPIKKTEMVVSTDTSFDQPQSQQLNGQLSNEVSPYYNTKPYLYSPDGNKPPMVATPKNKLNFENVPITPDVPARAQFHECFKSLESVDMNSLLSSRIIRESPGSATTADSTVTCLSLPCSERGLTSQSLRVSSFSVSVSSASSVRSPLVDCSNNHQQSPNLFSRHKRKIGPAKNLFNKIPPRSNIMSEVDPDVFHADSMPEFPQDTNQDHLRLNRNYSVPAIPVNTVFPKPVKLCGTRDLHKTESTDNNPLIGDLSRSHSLPILASRKNGLVFISVGILSQVLDGSSTSVSNRNVLIIDCRYPYEYEGGHIMNAINVFSKESIIEYFIKNAPVFWAKRADGYDQAPILVFHCEYSSYRGPNLAGFLRNKDRDIHSSCYPKLFYPEIYVLEGGYREFFQKCPHLCTPSFYVTMDDERFSNELIKYSKESKFDADGNPNIKNLNMGRRC